MYNYFYFRNDAINFKLLLQKFYQQQKWQLLINSGEMYRATAVKIHDGMTAGGSRLYEIRDKNRNELRDRCLCTESIVSEIINEVSLPRKRDN